MTSHLRPAIVLFSALTLVCGVIYPLAVTFSIGGIALGSAACASTITPLQLAGVTDIKDAKVINRLLALQLLDDDSDPANGIKLSADVKTALAAKTADFSATAATFNTAMSANLAAARHRTRATPRGPAARTRAGCDTTGRCR